MDQFIREKRYCVLKIKDIEKYLTSKERLLLDVICEKMSFQRWTRGIPDLECVVVENDWPIYEQVWDLIQQCEKERKENESENNK